MAQILRDCRDGHDLPDTRLEVTGTETGPDGETVNVNRVACRKCGTVRVTRWRPPDPSAQAQLITAMGTYEAPEPGDVPGLAERALLVTDAEYAEFIAQRGFPGGIPSHFAPDRRTVAELERLNLALQIRAGQFGLTDRGRSLGEILPVPGYAESAGLIDAVSGAALFWPPVEDGELSLTVVISPHDPGPDRSYASVAEVSCRFHTGYISLREIAGREIELPPLAAGHGDYRLRFHAGEPVCLLQIWPQPRRKPQVGV
ncbi:hypothetical protein [Actinomadura roseirufa]|uniref:hypothetical protein n=1 Tax=Actinomadura roseirufa TaxID=2094049 RepID=UPI0010417123|nr:hypothetical protein [Actinomadura roseirufa]